MKSFIFILSRVTDRAKNLALRYFGQVLFLPSFLATSIVVLLLALPCSAQNATGVEAFKPEGWYVLAKAVGDINIDGLLDEVAIFSKNDPNISIYDVKDEEKRHEMLTSPRLLVVALRREDGKFELGFKSEKIIMPLFYAVFYRDTVLGLCMQGGGVLDEENGVIVIKQGSFGSSDITEQTIKLYLKEGKWWITARLESLNRRTKKKRKYILEPKDATKFDYLKWLDEEP